MSATAANMLPGMPPPRPGIWPDYERPGREPLPVYEVQLAVSGSDKLEPGNEVSEALARGLILGASLSMEMAITVAKISHKIDGDKAIGMVAAQIEYMIPAEDGAAVGYIDRIKEFETTSRRVERAVDTLSDRLAHHIRVRHAAGQSIPTDLEDAHDALRAEIDHLRALR